MSDRWARIWFGTTAAIALAAVLAQLVLSASYPDPHFHSIAARVTNELAFFTIQSNLLAGIVCLFLAVRPTRSSPVFRVFQVAAVVGIAITALVYHAVLAGIVHLTGWWVVTTQLLHSVVPALVIVGWLLFGPRVPATWRHTGLALAYPAVWLVATLVRGSLVGWYPYPFVNVAHLGYPRVLLNAAVIAALFFGLAAAVTGLDRRRRRPALTPGSAGPA